MQRWGMAEKGEIPVANTNTRLVIAWLDKYTQTTDFATLTSVIAMLEVALDGALVEFLLDEVEDSLCHRVCQIPERALGPLPAWTERLAV